MKYFMQKSYKNDAYDCQNVFSFRGFNSLLTHDQWLCFWLLQKPQTPIIGLWRATTSNTF